jgi:phosphatidylglycerophosphate synthase
MSTTEFGEARRVATNVLAVSERRCLLWLAPRLPRWINSDHLTVLALLAMLMTGASYYLARWHPSALLLAVVWLAVNWFGDSLDGTLARVRGQQRPRYGFYVDHVVDCLGVLFLFSGLALSGYMSPFVALGLLVAYFMLSIEVYLATYCLTVFRLSFWGFGPTELRLVLAIGTLALLFDPNVEFLGQRYRLFDVGGLAATAGLAGTLVVSVIQNVRALYRAEPLPALAKGGR